MISDQCENKSLTTNHYSLTLGHLLDLVALVGVEALGDQFLPFLLALPLPPQFLFPFVLLVTAHPIPPLFSRFFKEAGIILEIADPGKPKCTEGASKRALRDCQPIK